MIYEEWQQYEKDFIKEVSGKMSRSEIAEKLERTDAAVATQASRLGIPLGVIRKNIAWRTNEIALFSSHTDREIKSITGRTMQSVQSKRYEIEGRRQGRK